MSERVKIKETWVHFHYSEDHGEWMPSINVKCYRYPRVTDMFPDMDEEEAERLDNAAWEESIAVFWARAQEIADDIWRKDKKEVRSCGRSGGWCSLYGLPEWDKWDKRTVDKWGRFEQRIKMLEDFVTTPTFVREFVEGNL